MVVVLAAVVLNDYASVGQRQVRTRVINEEWEHVFRGWYPQFHAQAA
jgi:hypothetical protein